MNSQEVARLHRPDTDRPTKLALSRDAAKELLAQVSKWDRDLPVDPEWPRLSDYVVLGQAESRTSHETFIVIRRGGDKPFELRLLRGAALDESHVSRIHGQLELLHGVRLPFVPEIVDFGIHETRPYVVSQLVEALPIDKYCDKCGLDLRQRVSILECTLNRIHRLHQKHGAHSDLDARNILIDENGQVYLTAYGIRTIASGLKCISLNTSERDGELSFQAPELMSDPNQMPNVSSDIFCIGKIAYSVLGESATAPLNAILSKATSGEPERRFVTADEFAAELARWLKGDPVLCARYSLLQRLSLRVSRWL